MRILGLGINKLNSALKRFKPDSSLLREGEEIFRSTNPFRGDFFVSNGRRLANGPRTFSKELRSLNFPETNINEITGFLGEDSNLYTVFSRELSNLSSSCPAEEIQKIFIRDLKVVTPFFKNNPEKLKAFSGYAKFLSVRAETNMALSPESLLNEGIYDFGTAAELMRSISKYRTQFYNCKEVPQIIKTSTMPKGHLTGIFDSSLSLLSTGYSKLDIVQEFANKILPKVNKNPEQLSLLMQELVTTRKGCFSPEEIKTVIEHLDSAWKKDFIINVKKQNPQTSIIGYLECLKNEKQAELILQDISPRIGSGSLQKLLKEGCLENEHQMNTYNLLKNVNISTSFSETRNVPIELERFPELALRDILSNIHSDIDYQLVKNMIEKRGVKGGDLYSTFAITRVLQQNPETKLKILERMKKPMNFDKIRANEELMHRIGSYKQERPLFQQSINRYSSNVSLTELQRLIPQGEAAMVGEKLMVNNGERLIELKLTEKAFNDLFVTDSFTFQGTIPDCGLVSTLDSLMATPKGKAYIYSLFESVPNSEDIIINLHGFGSKIKFPDGVVRTSNRFFYDCSLSSAKGLQMLEQAIHAAKTQGLKAENGLITMYKDCNFEAVSNSSLKGIAPWEVLDYVAGKNRYRTVSLTSLRDVDGTTIKTTMNKINVRNNSFAIIGTRENEAFDNLNNLMCGHHYHSLRHSNPDMSFRLVNPHYTNYGNDVDFYTVTHPKLMDHSYYFELV